ncbi:Fe-S cluster assembly protein NifU [Candidatus Methylospira mobilis]|uniref:Nitrogen fixation protein NifU n=1 Tax=Candidatus Methylospira mobilis TaxID=1808979 RepID=A0A5Q0BDB6_9GAMM|nr:Fe-S cluster assembly protein NifU [Candidatus Methylospira mobilis]QFY41845.1 Fe-S cluster assembly protein NifU [Candidatus Methylospira mobilis]WNV06715.1 Fe-S cluster assembly protein NifU [Candidatus Methylospira mobilis]
MWDYSEKVKEHFYQPRNVGVLEEANGVGDVGSISCGDALRLSLKVNPETDVIEDARFQTFGCGSAIASSSALTEIVKGMTLDDALKVTNQDIAEYLDGLPPEKMHCSVMGREALQAAIANYRGEEWSDDHEEGALICKCFAVDAVLIEETIRINNLHTVEEVTNYTKAGGGCSSCHEGIEEILVKVLTEKGEVFSTDVKKVEEPAPLPIAAKKSGALTSVQRIRRIEAVIEAIRPNLRMDGGDAELVEVDGNRVYIKMTGACAGCGMANMTIGGIQQKLMEDLGEFIRVIPADQLAHDQRSAAHG